MRLAKRVKNIIRLFLRKERKFYFFVCKRAGYCIVDTEMFHEAFIHKSVMKHKNGVVVNNERLEYLGDAVLDLLVADILYRQSQKIAEGEMSRLRGDIVSRQSLNAISMDIGLCKYIEYKGKMPIEQTHLPGDALEAFVGAIYLDAGLEQARRFVKRYVATTEIVRDAMAYNPNQKSGVLEWCQKNGVEISFDTREVGRTEDGLPKFECRVTGLKSDGTAGCDDGYGVGRTKKLAEQNAALDWQRNNRL